MKRRTKVIALATSLLVGVSMMGVGFATWVISSSQTDTAEGNVKAETVDNQVVVFEATPATGSNIIFGAPSTTDIAAWVAGTTPYEQSHTDNGWLANEAHAESLSVDITLTFTSGTIHSLAVADTYDKDGDGGTAFAEAKSANYITGPTYALATSNTANWLTVSSNGNITITGGEHKIASSETVVITITYGWGTEFGSMNPYYYYNGQAFTTSLASEATTKLGALYTALGEDTTFTFTFTAA